MNILGVLFGLLVLVVLFAVWIRAYKSVKGQAGENASGPAGRPRQETAASLEEFVAAYRRGEIQNPPGSTQATATTEKKSAAAASAPAKRRDPFLSPEVRLVYHLCRTGLRNHHVFASLPLAALCVPGNVETALSNAGVDLLVCNADMAPVAAIDVIGGESTAPDPAKTGFLKALGIRYLRLSGQSPPKPDALHALLYRM